MKRTALAFVLAALFPVIALAHSPLKSTSPQDKAELKTFPAGITMTFGQPARITKVTLTHTAGDISRADRLELPSKAFETNVELTPEDRGSGEYGVDWRALSKDGHVLKGRFSFKVSE